MISSVITALTDWASSQLLPLADATLKSTLLLSAALAVGTLGRKQSPAWRGWVLWLALLFTPLVFVLSFLIPEWRWDAAWVMGGGQSIAGAFNIDPFSGGDFLSPAETTLSKPDSALAASGIPWAAGIFLTWTLGAGATGWWALLRCCRSFMARRACRELKRGALVDVLEHERLEAGLRRRPKLYSGDTWAMPATWGILRPAILLPREAGSWSAGRLRHVLWHEMAHIVRRDAVASLLAAPAALLLWFHPLAWVVRRMMVDCREAACDDWVITHGQAEATAYSADLLAIVRHHFHRDQPIAGLAMAQSSKVAGRVRRLLQEETSRTGLTSGKRLVLTGFGLATLAATTLLISCRAPLLPPAPESALLSNVPHGVGVVSNVNLPKANVAAARKMAPPRLQTITVNSEGKTALNTVPVSVAELETKLTAAKGQAAGKEVPILVRGDSGSPYQGIMDVLDMLGRVGFTQIGLVIASPNNSSPP